MFASSRLCSTAAAAKRACGSASSSCTRRHVLNGARFRGMATQSASKAAVSTTRDKERKVVQNKSREDQADTPVDEHALGFLQRPLGFKERPTTVARTWQDNMLDDETRKAQREKLVKEATKGYFTDLAATRNHGGKTWVAPKTLIREDKALYFPDIVGTPLNGRNKVHTTDMLLGKVSVLSMLSSKISEIQSNMFIEPTHAQFKENTLYQHIQINLQENLLKSLLVSLFAKSIRRAIPESEWGNYLISSQNMDYLREDIGMSNKHLGYVYLIDPACRIRWAGCADPMPQEVKALQVCTEVLLKRVAKGKGDAVAS